MLLYALRWTFLRYDKSREEQIELGREAIKASLTVATAIDRVTAGIEEQGAKIAALKTALDARERG